MASTTPPLDGEPGPGSRTSDPLDPVAGGRAVRISTRADREPSIPAADGATPVAGGDASSAATEDETRAVPDAAGGADERPNGTAPAVDARAGGRPRIRTAPSADSVRPPTTGPAVVVHRPNPRTDRRVPRTPDRDYTRVTPAVASAVAPSAPPLAPLPSPAETTQRRPLMPLILAGLLAVALGAVVVMTAIYALSGDDEPSADSQLSPSAGASAGASDTASPPGSALSSPSATPTVSVAPVGGGTGAPGLVATAGVVAGDSLEVTESVTWPDGGPVEIRLQLPDLGSISGLPDGLAPTIRELQVSVDGNPVEPIPGIVAGSWIVRPLDVGVPDQMELRYLVDGALLRSTPSQPGRALAVFAPLSAVALGDLPVEIRLAGTGVLNVACAGAPDATSALCAHHEGDIWAATPPDGSPAVVVAQLDLSPPA